MTTLAYLVVAFAVGLATDVVWCRWHRAVAGRRAIVAANWSVLIFATSVAYTLLIVANQWASVASFAAGAWVGTYLTVRRP